jgi:ATP-dependent DNA ligase
LLLFAKHLLDEATPARSADRCEGIVSKRKGSPYVSGRSKHWVEVKDPHAPAMRREQEEDWS